MELLKKELTVTKLEEAVPFNVRVTGYYLDGSIRAQEKNVISFLCRRLNAPRIGQKLSLTIGDDK